MENIKLPSSLLSRFDLIFILVDTVDDTRDRLISEHIMNIHNKTSSKSTNISQYPATSTSTSSNAADEMQLSTLTQRLRKSCAHVESMLTTNKQPVIGTVMGSSLSLLSVELYRKYIEYAKLYAHPKLTPSTAKLLQKFYLTMRSEALIGTVYSYIALLCFYLLCI